MERERISQFYDRYVARQQRAAFNERHLRLYDNLKRAGLRADSRVLELGCGIGVITTLVAGRVRAGRIVAVDLSPASIAAAQRTVPRVAGLELLVGDITTLRLNETFDFVTLFDVVEHVPLDLHAQVFQTVSAHCTPGTTVLINIPNPAYTEYLRLHEPATLQVVDEAVFADSLLGHAYAGGLELVHFKMYGLWHEDEYQFLSLRPRRPFEKRARPPRRFARLRAVARAVRWRLLGPGR